MLRGVKLVLLFACAFFLCSACSSRPPSNIFPQDGFSEFDRGKARVDSLALSIENEGGLTAIGVGISTRRDIASDKAAVDALAKLHYEYDMFIESYQKEIYDGQAEGGSTDPGWNPTILNPLDSRPGVERVATKTLRVDDQYHVLVLVAIRAEFLQAITSDFPRKLWPH